MASPKELVAAVARHTGVAQGTVILHDRNLLVSGYRTEGQRGRGSSNVTFEDGANLLIAVAGSRNVKDSAATVARYAELIASAPLVFDDDGKEVRRGATFGDAVAALLQAVPADRGQYAAPNDGLVEVSLFGPTPRARIVWKFGGKSAEITYTADEDLASAPWLKGGASASSTPYTPTPDLKFIAQFTQVTLGFVGELIAG